MPALLLVKCIPLLLVVISMQGCPKFGFDFDLKFDYFRDPLVDPARAECPEELIGSYVGRDESTFIGEFEKSKYAGRAVPYFHIGRAGNGYPNGCLRLMTVTVPKTSKGTLQSSSTIFFVKKVGSNYIMHLLDPFGDDGVEHPRWDAAKWEAAKRGGYMFLAIRRTKTGIDMRMINLTLLDELIANGKLEVAPNDDSSVRLIVTPAAKVEALFVECDEKMFESIGEPWRKLNDDE